MKKVKVYGKTSPCSCSPKIWKKFSEQEKYLWLAFYNNFVWEQNFHVKFQEKKDKDAREVSAHNMACEAIWILKDMQHHRIK